MNLSGLPGMMHASSSQPLFGTRGKRPRRNKQDQNSRGTRGDSFQPSRKTTPNKTVGKQVTQVATPPATPDPEVVKLDQGVVNQALNRANSVFTATVMNKLANRAVKENLVVSPFNTFLLSNTLVLGTKDGTQSELANVLGLDQVVQQGATRRQLASAVQTMTQELKDLENTGIKFRNGFGLWKKAGEDWKQSFLDNMSLLNAEVGHLTGGAKPINDWASRMTEGKISQIVNDQEAAAASMVLGAATYFDAEWRTKFKDFGRTMAFHGTNGVKQAPEIELKRGAFNYVDSEKSFSGAPAYEAWTMPYGLDGLGNELKMSVFLPKKKNGLKDVYTFLSQANKQTGQSNLTENLEFLKDEQRQTQITLRMPKFKSDSETNTKEVLQALGVNKLFSSNQCDLSEMAEKAEGLYVSNMKQKAFIEVDKDGTRGGAVDVAIMARTSVQVDRSHQINVDRPFLYVIHDNSRPIMLGTVNNVEG